MGTYAAPPREKKGRGWLKGCCIGCACAVVLVIILLVIAFHTLFGMRPVAPPETFLTSKAAMFAVGQLTPDDEALVKLLQERGKKLAAQGRAGRAPTEAEQVRENLTQLLPAHAVLVLTRAEEEEGTGGMASDVVGDKFKMHIAIGASPEGRMGRILTAMARWMVSLTVSSCEKEGGTTEEYKRVKIGVSRDDIAVAAVDNNFMIGDDTDVVKEWIDRIAAQKEAQEKAGGGPPPVPAYEGPDELKRMCERLDHKALLYFACTNVDGEIKDLLDAAREAEPKGDAYEMILKIKEIATLLAQTDISSESVIVVGGTVHITGPDTAGLEATIECKDADSAERLAAQFKAGLEQGAKDGGSQEYEAKADGAIVKIKLTIPGLQELLEKLAEKK